MSKLLVFLLNEIDDEIIYQKLISISEQYGILIEKFENTESVISIGNSIIDYDKIQVHKNDISISLTYREFMCLYYLVKSRGVVLKHQYLYELVWQEKNYLGSTSSISALISKLRKKLEDDPRKPKYILTVRDVGYRFNPEL